jgi:hypothetical protein
MFFPRFEPHKHEIRHKYYIIIHSIYPAFMYNFSFFMLKQYDSFFFCYCNIRNTVGIFIKNEIEKYEKWIGSELERARFSIAIILKSLFYLVDLTNDYLNMINFPGYFIIYVFYRTH